MSNVDYVDVGPSDSEKYQDIIFETFTVKNNHTKETLYQTDGAIFYVYTIEGVSTFLHCPG